MFAEVTGGGGRSLLASAVSNSGNPLMMCASKGSGGGVGGAPEKPEREGRQLISSEVADNGSCSHGGVLGVSAKRKNKAEKKFHKVGGAAGAEIKRRRQLISHCASVAELLGLRAQISTFIPDHTNVALATLLKLLEEVREEPALQT